MNPRFVSITGMALLAVIAGLLAWRWGGGTSLSKVVLPRANGDRGASRQPALPAPKIRPSASTSNPAPEPTSGHPLLGRVMEEGGTVLKLEQLRAYLAANQRNAESLVTASRVTNDLSLLREAVARFPDDARAQLDLALRSSDPQERGRALEALRAADPNNAMGSYLSAAEAFKAGRSDDAVKLLSEAMQRTSMDDYAMANVVSAEEAYLSAGFTPLQAKAAAMYGMAMPQTSELNRLSQEMETLRSAYAGAGDADSAQAMIELGIDLGQRVQQSLGHRILINDLVGVAIEQRALKTLDPAMVLADSGLTVEQRLEQLAARRDVVKRTVQGADPTAANVAPEVLAQFLDRQKALGELAALQWLRGRLGLAPAK